MNFDKTFSIGDALRIATLLLVAAVIYGRAETQLNTAAAQIVTLNASVEKLQTTVNQLSVDIATLGGEFRVYKEVRKDK